MEFIKKYKWIIGIVLICVIVGGAVWSRSMQTSNETDISKSNENKIWELVQADVASELKQPETAKFEDMSHAKFYKISKDIVEVLGSVEGENALGNMVSNLFAATVILDSDGKPTIVSKVEFVSEDRFEERIRTNELLTERVENDKETYLTEKELNEIVKEQPLYVKEARFIDSSELEYSGNSMVQATLYNNGDVAIKEAVIGFVAWDKNRLPVIIKGYMSITEGEYLQRLNLEGLNLAKKETYTGKTKDGYEGMQIEKDLEISHIKAIVISFEDFDGNVWYNPNLIDFKNLYEEKPLVE